MATAQAPNRANNQVIVYQHSTLFYFWPVWAAGFIMGFISLFSGQRMAIVPEGSFMGKLEGPASVLVVTKDRTEETVEVATAPTAVPDGSYLVALPPKTTEADLNPPHLTVSSNRSLAVLFCTILLIVTLITNVPMRGLYSVIVLVLLVSGVIILSLADAWKFIVPTLQFLDIRINTAGYFVLSGGLLIMWLVVFFFFDRLTYMRFTPGMLSVIEDIGEGVVTHDTRGMTVQRERNDFFRHWILGMGSGDLVFRVPAAGGKDFRMSNVMFVDRKLAKVKNMVQQAGAVNF